jgi:hypothetical protein
MTSQFFRATRVPQRYRVPPVDRRKAHGPLTEFSLRNRLMGDEGDAGVAIISAYARVHLVDGGLCALEHLEETSVDVQQHAGQAGRFVVGARLLQQRGNLVLYRNALI